MLGLSAMRIRNIFYILFITVFLASCSSSKYAVQKERGGQTYEQPKEKKKRNKSSKNKEAKKIIDYASKFKGVRYKYAGNTPKGFDCSGYVQYVFRNFDYILPRSSTDQSKIGKNINKKDLEPGDLVFFKGTKSSKVGHVGIVVEIYNDNSFKFIHVSSNRGVVEDYSTTNYWAQRYLRARRILSG